MPLQDFLGSTVEIKLFDFLAANFKYSYNQSELSKQTGISRSRIYEKIPEMIKNNLVIIDGKAGNYKTYRIADNELVNHLVAAIFEHNFTQLESPDKETEKGMEESRMESPTKPMENRYYVSPNIELRNKSYEYQKFVIDETSKSREYKTYRIENFGDLKELPAATAESA